MYERFRPRVGEGTPDLPRPQRKSHADTKADVQHPKDGSGPLLIEGVYIISVAARILDMHPQTLRKYERLGLIRPSRTMGMLRLYSREDIQKLRLIRHLAEDLGLNLAGVELTLNMVDNLLRLRKRLGALAEGTPLQMAVEREIDQLFHSLNLPAEGW